jgi:transcriptional regulator with XRE-family HTH domain
MHNEIQALRKNKNMTLTELALAVNSTPQQIGRLEKGERRLTVDWIDKIARALNVLPEDLLTGNHGERVVIPEIDMASTRENNDSTKSSVAESDSIVSEWALPKQLLANQVGSNSTMRIIQVMGDSMQPEFNPGDRVMVNTADRMPSPPGVFVLWDGFGLIIKRCEMIPKSDPPRTILSSANKNYATYESEMNELDIQGRVVGKWQWT